MSDRESKLLPRPDFIPEFGPLEREPFVAPGILPADKSKRIDNLREKLKEFVKPKPQVENSVNQLEDDIATRMRSTLSLNESFSKYRADLERARLWKQEKERILGESREKVAELDSKRIERVEVYRKKYTRPEKGEDFSHFCSRKELYYVGIEIINLKMEWYHESSIFRAEKQDDTPAMADLITRLLAETVELRQQIDGLLSSGITDQAALAQATNDREQLEEFYRLLIGEQTRTLKKIEQSSRGRFSMPTTQSVSF